jgi:diketogulonate reductase-like aldo/keto reductase
VCAIGVSNFMAEHLLRLLAENLRCASCEPDRSSSVLPADRAAASACRTQILTQAWSPIGGITSYRGREKRTFDDATLREIARQHGKSAAQVMLRWHVQEGRSAIQKSTNPARIAENFGVFDSELSRDQIDAIDTGARGGPDPDNITLEAYGKEIPEA